MHVVLGVYSGPGVFKQQLRGPTGGKRGGARGERCGSCVPYRYSALSTTAWGRGEGGGRERPWCTGHRILEQLFLPVPTLETPARLCLPTPPCGGPCQAMPPFPWRPLTSEQLQPEAAALPGCCRNSEQGRSIQACLHEKLEAHSTILSINCTDNM